MTRIGATPSETSCLISNLFTEIRPVCGRCEGDSVVLCGVTYEGQEETVVLRDYGFDYSGDPETKISESEGASMGTRRNYQRTSNKNDSPLHVLPVAERLIDYTLDLTDNAKRLPKRVRFSITNKIQGHVMAIYDDLLEANEIFPIRTEADRTERLRLQRTALTECKKLLHMIELSKKRTYIDKDTFDYWTKLTLDVKFMTAKWYKAEQDTAEAIAPSDPIPESV